MHELGPGNGEGIVIALLYNNIYRGFLCSALLLDHEGLPPPSIHC